jgi:16S rRNA (adenine1518-N6/adenine1519-N6)-dimethyltransferase
MRPRAKKSLGQHFLRNPDIARRIVDRLQIGERDQVLEIGPGAGALTGLILERQPARLILLEKDDHWAALHARALRGQAYACALSMSALDFPWETLDGPWKLIGNLPYNIASPLIWECVSRVHEMSLAVFMTQKEVAERLVAPPGGRAYGALSVWVQSFAGAAWGFTVGPGNFSPPPKVDSAVISMTALPRERRPHNPAALARMTALCFQQRRKQLQTILRRQGIAGACALLEALGIDPEARPETLDCATFHSLAVKCVPLLLTSGLKHD